MKGVSAVANTTFTALQSRNADLIRKSLDAAVFLAPTTAPLVTALTANATADLQTLPVGYVDVGWMDKSNAVKIAAGITSSPVDSFGSIYPTRSDITKSTVTVAITMQETKALTLGVYSQVNVAALTSNPTTGEVAFSDPVRPSTLFYRLLILWTDLSGVDTIYGAVFMPRVSVTALADMNMQDGEAALDRGVTFTAYPDAAAGYAVKRYFGGPGWLARTTAMGFAVGSGS